MLDSLLSHEVQISRISNAVAAGTTTVTSSPVDMAADGGWDGVMFVVLFGTITDGTPAVKARQGEQANMSDGADLAGTLVSGAVTDDNKLLAVDVHQPRERYVDCQVIRGGATGAVIDGILAIKYRPRKVPITQHSTLAAIERHVSPAEGTA